MVKLEDLAAHFKLKTQEAIDRVTTLLADGLLTGVAIQKVFNMTPNIFANHDEWATAKRQAMNGASGGGIDSGVQHLWAAQIENRYGVTFDFWLI